GLIWSIPGGPPLPRFGARARASSICCGVSGHACSRARGVRCSAGNPVVSGAAPSRGAPALSSIMQPWRAKDLASSLTGGGREVEALSRVRTADARSWNIDRPDGVVRPLQVIEYKVEPSKTVLARYLLANNHGRSTSGDESEALWPEVSVVREAAA